MFGDLLNPVTTTAAATPGLFRKAGPGPVTYTPVIALGLTTRNRGGWYRAAGGRRRAREDGPVVLHVQEHGRGPEDRQEPAAAAGEGLANPVRPWRPAVRPLGLQRRTQRRRRLHPACAGGPRSTRRLAKQPYKAMIYPNRDKATGRLDPAQLPDRLGILDQRRLPGRRLPGRQRGAGRASAAIRRSTTTKYTKYTKKERIREREPHSRKGD